MLWECSECGETTSLRTKVCASCGVVTRYNLARDADDRGAEVGSLREYWVAAGAERWKPPLYPR